jgi:uncharacterized protein YdhG (YjbR/CyaY superfamily)
MAETKTAKKNTRVIAKASKGKGFSAEEKAAMRQRVKEVQGGKGEGEGVVLEKIREMKPADRAMAERLHALLKASVPELSPRLWYGMPAYAIDGKTICFFQDANKFKTRYATLGFSDKAKLDEGGMWPNSYALEKFGPAEEAKIAALIKKAVG